MESDDNVQCHDPCLICCCPCISLFIAGEQCLKYLCLSLCCIPCMSNQEKVSNSDSLHDINNITK